MDFYHASLLPKLRPAGDCEAEFGDCRIEGIERSTKIEYRRIVQITSEFHFEKAYSSKMQLSRFWFAFARLLRVIESPKPRDLALPLCASTTTIKSRKLSRRES